MRVKIKILCRIKRLIKGIKETMLKEEVIPREIIKYSEEIQEQRRLQETNHFLKILLAQEQILSKLLAKNIPFLLPYSHP